MRAQMRGMALVEMLIGLSILTVLLSAALPLGHRVYARAAVTYEAMRLAAELRRIQAISRTTATVLYVLDRDRRAFASRPSSSVQTVMIFAITSKGVSNRTAHCRSYA